MSKNITKVLNKMTNNLDKNIKILKKTKYDLNDLLYTLVNSEYNEDKSLLAIESILRGGFDININESFDGINPNFLFKYINYVHTSGYYLKVFKLAVEYGINVNKRNTFNNTLIHLLFENKYIYGDEIIEIYKLFIDNGFDIFKLNNDFESIYDKGNKRFANNFIKLYEKDRKRLLPLKIEERKREIDKIIKSDEGEFLSHLKNEELFKYIATEYYDDEIILELIKYLYELKIDPNSHKEFGGTHINSIIKKNRSKDFIFKALEIGLKYNLDPNYKTSKGLNYLEDIIINNLSRGKILPIYKLLLANGFKYDYDYEEIKKSIYNYKQYISDYEEFLKVLKQGNKSNDVNIVNKDVELPEGFDYDFLYGNNNRFTLITGNNEEDKDYVFDKTKEYLINKYNEELIYTNYEEIINNCISIGSLKNDLVKIMKDCVENNKVLMIKDIDKLYRENITDEEKVQIDILLLYYIEKEKLKIIATCDIKKVSLFRDSLLYMYMNYKEIKGDIKQRKRTKNI